MKFDEQWVEARAVAAERQNVVRLNSVDSGVAPGAGAPDIASTPAKKRSAANAIEIEVEPNTKKAGRWADAATGEAVAGFAGWATADGLKTVRTTWEGQVKTLVERLVGETIALRDTARTTTEYELDLRQRIGTVRTSGIEAL
ncbi:hypothetical protein ABZ707_11320 [Streptomyces sp. NPDC006923]|uniref:hypothetical protein n=1 Tax=Streptomyces sp. NPDC006923 TaxID=3155355 RepID=UPI0033D14C82